MTERNFVVAKGRILAHDGYLEREDTAPLRPSRPSEPTEDLQRRFHEDGYLFVKHLLPRCDVLSCRREYIKFLSSTDIMQPCEGPAEGTCSRDDEPTHHPHEGTYEPPFDHQKAARFLKCVKEAHGEPWYLHLSHHPALQAFVERLWGEDIMLSPRSPSQDSASNNNNSIDAHDSHPLGLVWVPIGDMSVQGGGPVYMENSMNIVREMECGASIEMGDGERVKPRDAHMMVKRAASNRPRDFGRLYRRRWLVGPYIAGDVVLYHPRMIHTSTINRDPDIKLGLGADLRFAKSASPNDPVRRFVTRLVNLED